MKGVTEIKLKEKTQVTVELIARDEQTSLSGFVLTTLSKFHGS